MSASAALSCACLNWGKMEISPDRETVTTVEAMKASPMEWAKVSSE